VAESQSEKATSSTEGEQGRHLSPHRYQSFPFKATSSLKPKASLRFAESDARCCFQISSLFQFSMVEPLLSGIVLGLVPVTLAGLFVTAYLQYRRGDRVTNSL